MSDQFLRLVSRSAKFDARAAHSSTRHLDLAAPQKSAAASAPASSAKQSAAAAALNFFNAAPAAAAPAAPAAAPATPARGKQQNGSASKSKQQSASQLSGKKRSRARDEAEEEEQPAAQSDDDDDEGADMKDDGGNDLDGDESDGEDIELFGGAHAPTTESTDEEGEGGEDGAPSAAVARAKALKSYRRSQGIHVTGTDIPAPFRAFTDLPRLGVPEYMVRNLTLPAKEDGCGYTEPTPIQQQAIPILLKERELLACAPTGSGKTAAFVVPILASLGKPGKTGKFRALVLSPVRELAEQTHRCFMNVGRGRAWKVMNLLKANASANVMSADGSAAHAKRDVLIATPALLVHLIESGGIDLSAIEWLVLDEADRLFEGGAKGFLEQLDAVIAACTNPRLRKALFSATMMQGVESLARTVLRDPVRITIGARNSATSSIQQSLVYVSTEEGKLVALRQMVQKGLDIPVLIFVQSKERAQQLYGELVYDNLQVDVIHADRTAAQRASSMRRFRAGQCWVLIATDLIARGIDIPGVKTVLNYDFPQSTVSYIHRIGRTGRAGRQGKAVTFFTEADKPLLPAVAKLVHQSGSEVPEWMLQMQKIGTKKAKKLQEQAPPRQSIVPSAKNAAANKKARDRKKKRKLEGGAAKGKASAAAAE